MFTNPLTQVFAQTKKLIKKRWTEKTQPGELVSAQAMSDEVFLAQFDLAEVSTWLAQGNIELAKKALLSHYAQRISPARPAFPNKITDLGIDLYQLSRQELVALADSILGYHFLRGLGRELRITPTGTIDWGFNPGSDSEWLWLLNRQPWWPILAWA
ncbi:MAG TPA: heparinase II/III family protein, partial [Anaerolineae bacterium]|nr:heparinase II/III family protein [Anaerolineae bacterium]